MHRNGLLLLMTIIPASLIAVWAAIRVTTRKLPTNRCTATNPSAEILEVRPLTFWERGRDKPTPAVPQHGPARTPSAGQDAMLPETADVKTIGTVRGAPAFPRSSAKETRHPERESGISRTQSPTAARLLRDYRLDQLGMDQDEITRLLESDPDGAVILDLAINQRRWLEDRLGPLAIVC